MKHCGTIRLETGRLILRRFTIEDADAMYRNWASDGDVTKFLTWPTHKSRDDSEHIISEWLKTYEDDTRYLWAIVPKEIGEPIGNIAVRIADEDLSVVHVGYCIGKAWWHKGFTSEALGAVIELFFDKVGANRIEAYHDPRNPNSGGVMKKCGMIYEGTLRQYQRNNQGIHDACIYSILKSEYKMNEG